jgi:hypothetical protein
LAKTLKGTEGNVFLIGTDGRLPAEDTSHAKDKPRKILLPKKASSAVIPALKKLNPVRN